MPRLPCSVRPPAVAVVSAVRASRASPIRRMRAIRLVCRSVASALAASAALALAGCDGGAIGQDTPASNGQSFVSGSYGTTFLRAGQRPAEPAVAGTTLTGRRLSLASYRGRVLVINFWGSWCPPCRQEAPALGTLARQFRSMDVRFLGVDIQDNVSGAEAFARTFRITYPSLNDPSDNLALDFRNTVPPAGIPTTLVISPSGRISARVIGEASYDELKSLIRRAAAEPG